MLDFDKYECYNLPHVTTCPSFPYFGSESAYDLFEKQIANGGG